MDNGYLTGLSGCQVAISGAIISSGGCIVNTSAPQGANADILLTSGGSVTVATTFPVDLSAAYQDYIAAKQEAIYSGGSCVYVGGSPQVFSSGGCYSTFCDTHLMTLNGVGGSLETGDSGHKYKSNVNFLPTVGFWVETDLAKQNNTDVVASVFRVLHDCVKCEDYNNLFVMEMILYHAINKMTWRIMRATVNGYTPGVWRQYQGALYRWNANTYAAQYVYEIENSYDSFLVKLGWVNTTCTGGAGFASWCSINLVDPAEPSPDYRRYRLLYPGAPVTKNTDTVIAFIANVETETILYISGSAPDAATKQAAGLSSELDTYFAFEPVTSVQDFNDPNNVGNWVVGVICTGISGDGYGAMAFQLGVAQNAGVDFTVSPTEKWTYNVKPEWTTRINSTDNSYTPETADAVIVDALISD